MAVALRRIEESLAVDGADGADRVRLRVEVAELRTRMEQLEERLTEN
jgi:hypothetical protein